MFDQILLPPLQWVVSGGFWQTLLICLVICPALPQLLGVVFVSYWAPWNPRYQFWAYIPGNPCLALFIAGASTTVPSGDFRINPVLNIAAVIGALVVYWVLTWMDSKVYTRGQMWSANKLYHNLLYFWYGYLAVVCFIGVLGSAVSVGMKVLIVAPGVLWLTCLVIDMLTSRPVLVRKWKYAHAENLPLWKTGWHLRRRTKRGYELAA